LKEIIKRLFHVGEGYDYILAIAFARSLKADYLLKKLNTYEAIIESDEFLSSQKEQITEIQEIMFMGFKGESQFLNGDTIGARETISKACAEMLNAFASAGVGGLAIQVPKSAGIVGWVFNNREPALVNNVYEDTRFYPEIDKKSELRTNNILCVPFLTAGERRTTRS